MIPSALQDGQHGIFPNDTYFAKEERDIIIRVHKEIHDKKNSRYKPYTCQQRGHK